MEIIILISAIIMLFTSLAMAVMLIKNKKPITDPYLLISILTFVISLWQICSEELYVAVPLGDIGQVPDLTVDPGHENFPGDDAGGSGRIVDGHGGVGIVGYASEIVEHKTNSFEK